jgi:hypothetical protein
MPAKAGIQSEQRIPATGRDAFMYWVPAFAGTTEVDTVYVPAQ